MTSVNIFIMCYNEENIIKQTIQHYKKNLPNSKIYIIDNFSDDQSINIAKKLECNIIPLNTGKKMKINAMNTIKNVIYKNVFLFQICLYSSDKTKK